MVFNETQRRALNAPEPGEAPMNTITTSTRCKFCDAPIELSASGFAWLDKAGIAECVNGETWHGQRARIDASHEPTATTDEGSASLLLLALVPVVLLVMALAPLLGALSSVHPA